MDPELLSLDRLPLPSLRVYTVLSVFAASFSLYYIGTESGSVLKKLSEKHDSCSQLKLLLSENTETVDRLNIINDKIDKYGNFGLDNNDGIVSDGDKNGDSGSLLQSASLASFSASLGKFAARYFANDYWWSAHAASDNEREADSSSGTIVQKNVTESDCFNNEEEGYQTWQLLHWASQQPHCVWPLVNLVYCILILGIHAVQQSVFGNLRCSEQENIKEQFWNLVFYKVVFVFGVVDVQEVEDAVGWCFFVSVIGFLQLARQLCQERHNYLIMVNDMTKSSEARQLRILRLLTFIFATSICLFLTVVVWFWNSTPSKSNDFLDYRTIIPFTKPFDAPGEEPIVTGPNFNLGLHSAIFMLSEISLLILQTLHALTSSVFDYMYFRLKTCKWNPISLFGDKDYAENEDLYLCTSQDINYKFEFVSLMFDLIHHMHMFVCCNLFLSMTSLIVALQMKQRAKQIHTVLKRMNEFISLNEHIDRYSDVQLDDTDHYAYTENCAICWETLASQKSKILPCNHTFHKTCLRKWLIVSMHCPTCRLSLLSEKEAQLRRENEPRRRNYGPRPAYGIMGMLQTCQTLLDLFGGWDPQPENDYTNSGPVYSESPPVTPSPDANRDQSTPEGTSRTTKNN